MNIKKVCLEFQGKTCPIINQSYETTFAHDNITLVMTLGRKVTVLRLNHAQPVIFSWNPLLPQHRRVNIIEYYKAKHFFIEGQREKVNLKPGFCSHGEKTGCRSWYISPFENSLIGWQVPEQENKIEMHLSSGQASLLFSLSNFLTLLVFWASWKELREQICFIACPEKCVMS